MHEQLGSEKETIVAHNDLAERGKTGHARYPALLFELFKESSSPYINRFLSADSIVPGYANPQNLNRYSYVTNNPLRYTDPTGHFCTEEDANGNIIHVNCGTGLPPSGGGGAGGGNGSGGGGGDYCSTHPESCGLPPIASPLGDSTSSGQSINPNAPPCAQVFSASTCQQIGGVLSVGALTLDTVAAVGTGIFALLELVSLLGGPIGIGSVEAAYLVANLVEGWMGAASFLLTATNDFLVTGGSYITGGTQPEIVLSSDVVISGIFALAGGADPEPFGDTLMNGTSAIYDTYRFTGGDALFSLHIGLSGWHLTE